MKEKIKNQLYWLLPVIITVLIVFIVYIIKAVYPFGDSNIAYYDMNQVYIPSYARMYEVFHGKDSLLFDWLEGAGMDMTSSFQGCVLNPFNWFFFFIKPEYVLNFMSVFLVIKLVFIAVSISYYTKRAYDLPLHISVVLSLLYTFSGYTIQYYTNIFFLDAVMILPMIILAIRSMCQTKKVMSYILLMTWLLAESVYQGFMMLLFVLLYSFGMMFLICDKKERGAFVARLGLSTFVSLGIAAASLVPTIIKWTKLSRTSDISLNIGIFGFSISNFQHQKLFMIFNTELAVAIFGMVIAGAILNRKNLSRETIFRLYVFFIMLMPVLNEGTDLLWHMGSYVHFPYRCAYMLIFAGIELIAYSWDKYGDETIFQVKSKIVHIVLCVFTATIALINIIIGVKLYVTFFEYGIIGRNVSYYGLPEMIFLNVLFYVMLICFFNNKVRERVFCVITMLHLTVASVCFIAPTDYSKEDGFSYYIMRDKFIYDSLEIRNKTNMENDYVSRIKTLYPCLSRNYAMILGKPSITQFLVEAVAPFFDEVIKLGYDNDYTTNLDSGGTYFSDAVLNVKKAITYGDVYIPEKAYTKIITVGDYTICDMNYTLPFGMLMDEKILETDCDDLTAAEHQFQISEAFGGDEIQIFSTLDLSQSELIRADKEKREYVYRYNLKTNSPSLLYICTKNYCKVFVDDNNIKIPYFDEVENTNNKRNVKNTINLISEFGENETSYIDITLPIADVDQVTLFLLNLDSMAELSEKYKKSSVLSYEVEDNRLDMIADVCENNYLFLPLEYLDGWHATVNGNDAEILPVMNGAFMVVKLPGGHCDIRMRFLPQTIIKGVVITIIALAVSAILFIMKKRGKDVAEIPWVEKTASVVFTLVAVSALIVLYGLPVFI